MENWRRQRDWEVTRREAEAMIREGMSIPEVAHKLVVANSTVHRWMTKGGFRLKDLEREAAGEAPLPRPDWVAREQYRKAGGGELPPEYAERVARAQEELAAAAKERVALMRENGGKLAVPEVDPDAFARRAVAEAERLMGEGLYDLAERSMRIAERLARVSAFLAVGAGAGAAQAFPQDDEEERPLKPDPDRWPMEVLRQRIQEVFDRNPLVPDEAQAAEAARDEWGDDGGRG